MMNTDNRLLTRENSEHIREFFSTVERLSVSMERLFGEVFSVGNTKLSNVSPFPWSVSLPAGHRRWRARTSIRTANWLKS